MVIKKLLAFKTRGQKDDAKKAGKIEGYFGRVAKGRPQVAKNKKTPGLALKNSLPMNMTTKDVVRSGKKGTKDAHFNWNLPANFHLLKETAIGHINSKQQQDADENTGIIRANQPIIPRTTLQRHTKRFLELAKQKNVSLQALQREDIFPKCRGGGKGLLNENDIELLASTLIYRDEANRGMSRNEAIALVMELAQTNDRTSAENHFDYLVRMKRLTVKH